MKSSRMLWGSIGIVSLAFTCLLIFGLIYAVNDILFPKPSHLMTLPIVHENKDNPLAQDRVNIVALGDSLTKGTGDQTGKGYVGSVKDLLEKQVDKKVFVLANFAINGYRTAQLLNDLETKSGMADAIVKANIILFTIGGNDLFTMGSDVNPDQSLDKLPVILPQVKKILAKLNSINPKAAIVYVGLYNPFMDMEAIREKSSQLVQTWDEGIYQIIKQYPNMTLLPTYDLFEKNLMKYLSLDHFHPNQAGYERIAERIVQDLN